MVGPFPRSPAEMTAAWLEERRRAGELPMGQPIAQARAERIGVGYGLDGVLARVYMTGADGAAGTLVAKWLSPAAGAREAHALRAIAVRSTVEVTRLLAAFEAEDAALLLLRDISPAQQGDAIEGATPEQALRLVGAVANLQVAFHEARAPGALEGFRVWGADADGQAERTALRVERFLEMWSRLVPPRVLPRIAGLPVEMREAHARLATVPATLLHADLHLDNVLFRPDGTPVVIDWADAARGPGVVDVARILVEGLTMEAREAIEDEVWAHYMQVLAAGGIAVDPREVESQARDALVVMMGGVIRFKEPAADSPERLVPIIENLVRNVSAALD